ncbi:hypothetical protein CKO28_16500 [Rhodovibrio sodomensis]|uniref:DUF4112 domain-containing protein n=1 Tax=Rhodovibrio sodomensis TaxID=1088 RepID=A0ABS1DGP4_9PROT|nr:DUF4112 domain-containing protein [Rhodovibrio sodomensis]MBK1669640.1 hypothetical protein [Rhodovibrio sodomensis]
MTGSDASNRPDPAGPEPDGEAVERQLARLETLARVMDDVFRVPGTRLRFGLDGMIGLIPGVGDAATGALAGYLAVRAWDLGLPTGVVLRMAGNVGLDLVAGSIPVAGDLFDVGFKANRRNIELLKRELAKRAQATPKNVTPPRPNRASDRPGGRSIDPD